MRTEVDAVCCELFLCHILHDLENSMIRPIAVVLICR
jgi:hypothetical protein